MARTQIKGNDQILDLSIENLQIATNAGIETSKLADGAKLIQSDGSVPFLQPQVGITPTQANHLTTKAYVDGVVQSLDIKSAVKVATTGDITLSGVQVVDGVTLIAGDRVLVKDQTVASENGIYNVATGLWTRSFDADTDAEVTGGLFTFIQEGTANADTGWVLVTDDPITVDTTNLNFTQFTNAGTFIGGAGLVKIGNQLDIVSSSNAIIVNTDDIALALDDASLEIVAGGLRLARALSGQVMVADASGQLRGVDITGDVNVDLNGVTSINLGNGQIFVGDASGAAQSVTLTGDVTIDNTGATTLHIPTGQLMIGDGAGNAVSYTITGDITIDSAGVATVTIPGIVTQSDYVVREVPTGLINGSNTTFVLANTPILGSEMVFFNGQLMDSGVGNDYTIVGNTITTLWNPAGANSKILVTYLK